MKRIAAALLVLITSPASAQNYLRDNGEFQSVVTNTLDGQLLQNQGGVLGGIGAPPVYVVTCDITGVVDCSSAIQASLTIAEVLGGTVQPPCTGTGSILINAGFTINKATTFKGCGSEEFKGYQGQFFPQRGTVGTYINTTSTANSPITVGPGANGAVISDLAFTQTQPADTAGWTPTVYPPSISHPGASAASTSVGRLEVTRVLLAGVYAGIKSGTAPGLGLSQFTGRDYYHNIRGTCFSYCIDTSASSDTQRVQDIHVWPYFAPQNSAQGTTPNIDAYMQANASGWITSRNDNPMARDLFFYGVKNGIKIDATNLDGQSAGMQVVNLDCDNVMECVAVSSAGSQQYTVSIVNMTHAGQTNGTVTGSYAVHTSAASTGVKVNITNLNAFAYFGPAVFIEGTSNDFSLTNASVFHYNQQSGGTNPLISVAAGNAGWLYGRFSVSDNNSSPGLGSTNVTDLTATARTGTGSTAVYQTGPALIAPDIGAATGTSFNKLAVAAVASSATLTPINGVNFQFPLASGTAATLAGTETLTNKTMSGASNTFSNIGNPSLSNSSVTINGTAVSLGGSITVSAAPSGAAGGDLGGTFPNPTVTNGSHITNASIPNSGLATPAPCTAFGIAAGTCVQGGIIAATGPTGSATVAPIITVNTAGQVTVMTSATITPAASSITGGAALTKVDDTNVTLTLGGSPASSLLAATSITAGWTGTLANSRLAGMVTNTVKGNATSGTASPTDLAVGSCSTAASALIWTTNTGFGCNTSINAATLGGATFAAPGAIGGGTPSTGAFTTINGNTFTTGTGTLTIAASKTLTVSNTLTLTATDGSTLAIGAGGTLGTAAFQNTGTSGATVPLLSGANTFGASQTISFNQNGFTLFTIDNQNAGASAAADLQLTVLGGTASFIAAGSGNGGAFNWSWSGAGSTQFIAQNAAGNFIWYTGASPANKMSLSTAGVLNVVGGYSANGSAGITTTCTIAVGNVLTFTNGIITAKSGVAGCT